MPDEINTPEADAVVEDQPAAEPKKTDEHMIPKSRLDEVLAKNKELTARLDALDKARKEEEEKRLVDQQKYQELADKRLAEIERLLPKAAVAEDSEKTLLELLESQIAELPEDARGMVPETGSTSEKLRWISKWGPKLRKPSAPDIAAGKQGGGAPTDGLTPEEIETAKKFGMKLEDYAKNK